MCFIDDLQHVYVKLDGQCRAGTTRWPDREIHLLVATPLLYEGGIRFDGMRLEQSNTIEN